MLRWLLFYSGVGVLVAWVATVLGVDRIALTGLIRVGAAIQILVSALWYGLLSTLAILGGWWWQGLIGAVLMGLGLWAGVMFCLKPIMGLLGTPRPAVDPFYGEDEAVEATDEELEKKGIIR